MSNNLISIALVCGCALGLFQSRVPPTAVSPAVGKRCFIARSALTTPPPLFKEVGVGAWLFCELTTTRGWIFDPPGRLSLTLNNQKDPAQIGFTSAELLGYLYRFAGSTKQGILRGTLEYVRPHLDKADKTWLLEGAEIVASSGRWSSYAYSPESGDHLGLEVEIVNTTAGPSGLIVFYEGGPWSEYVGAPYAVQQVTFSPGVIAFQTTSDGETKRYELRLGSGRAELRNEKGESYGWLSQVPSLVAQLAGK